MGKQCWSQAVLESGSWGHSVLQTPALVTSILFIATKVSGILRHWGVQLYWFPVGKASILLAGKGRRGMFLFLLFLHFHSCSSFFPVPLFHLLYYSISFLLFPGRRHKMTHKG